VLEGISGFLIYPFLHPNFRRQFFFFPLIIKKARIALRANNACHYTETLERVRGKPKAAELEKVTEAWPPISRAVRVPHSDADYREVVELLDRVTDEVGEDENHPLASLLDVLGVLIEKYEDEHVPELTE
jgi:HTH-type transcriptional regulator / antitoxin HigA